jgi:FtsP/CotA-like multicopper oxidase with cupredoxin domain
MRWGAVRVVPETAPGEWGSAGAATTRRIMFHCHLLRHEDEGLMGQFVVVQPGQAPRQPPAHQHQG